MELMQSKQFIAQLKNKSGKDVEKIIEQILASDIYFLVEFIELPNIQALNTPAGKNIHYNTMVLMSSLTYEEYTKNAKNYIKLTPPMVNKLRIATILDIARDNKVIDYSLLMKALEIKGEYELEQILFEIFSKGLLQGDVNPMEKTITIICIKGRNTTVGDEKTTAIINNWIDNLQQVDHYIDDQINILKNEAKQYTQKA